MTQEDIIKELEAIKTNYSVLKNRYENAKENIPDFTKGVCSGWSEASGFIVSDIQQLLTKIKQQ